MANFFNELGKKLSDVGSTAMQKTKEFSDITKLNSAVAEEERNQGISSRNWEKSILISIRMHRKICIKIRWKH